MSYNRELLDGLKYSINFSIYYSFNDLLRFLQHNNHVPLIIRKDFYAPFSYIFLSTFQFSCDDDILRTNFK